MKDEKIETSEESVSRIITCSLDKKYSISYDGLCYALLEKVTRKSKVDDSEYMDFDTLGYFSSVMSVIRCYYGLTKQNKDISKSIISILIDRKRVDETKLPSRFSVDKTDMKQILVFEERIVTDRRTKEQSLKLVQDKVFLNPVTLDRYVFDFLFSEKMTSFKNIQDIHDWLVLEWKA